MYTRSYSDKESPVSIPENYDGTAFKENEQDFKNDEQINSDAAFAPPFFVTEREEEQNQNEAESAGAFSNLTNKFSLKSLLPEGGILGSLKKSFPRFSPPKIGTEEILIAALALYLFLSKDGDKECAIMLIILLFIG